MALVMPPAYQPLPATLSDVDLERLVNERVEARLKEREANEARFKEEQARLELAALEPTEAEEEPDWDVVDSRGRIDQLIRYLEEPWLENVKNASGNVYSQWLPDWASRAWSELAGFEQIGMICTPEIARINALVAHPAGSPGGSTGGTAISRGVSYVFEAAKFSADFWTQENAQNLFRRQRIPMSKVLLKYRTPAFCLEQVKASRMFLWEVPVAHRNKELCVLAIKYKLGGIHDVPPALRTAPEFVNACMQEGVTF